MKTIIVGGGISGLYLAYQLLKKHPNQKVEVIEGSGRLGGRVPSVFRKNTTKPWNY
jgi:protoporphyrinogen oxidase